MHSHGAESAHRCQYSIKIHNWEITIHPKYVSFDRTVTHLNKKDLNPRPNQKVNFKFFIIIYFFSYVVKQK